MALSSSFLRKAWSIPVSIKPHGRYSSSPLAPKYCIGSMPFPSNHSRYLSGLKNSLHASSLTPLSERYSKSPDRPSSPLAMMASIRLSSMALLLIFIPLLLRVSFISRSFSSNHPCSSIASHWNGVLGLGIKAEMLKTPLSLLS
jgi:hypothetical protein